MAPEQTVAATARSLRIAARESFAAADTAKAREHLQAWLALYRPPGTNTRDPNAAYLWSQRLGEVALEYLRAGLLNDTLDVLGEAADLDLPAEDGFDDGLASAAAGLHRRLAALDAGKRFESLRAWSMPTQSRRTVRVLTSLVPRNAPPKEFARALGERPRDDSFPISEINGVDGLFSTAWLLVKSAEETGRLRRLIAELSELAEDGVARSDDVLALARIVDGQEGEPLATSLREQLAVLQRERSPALRGKGHVPHNLIWQFGYVEVDADPRRVDMKPLPYWTGSVWQGAAEYPAAALGWTMLDATGGHTGQRQSPVRRWVAPADGTLAIVGSFQHIFDHGDGVRGRIVSNRSGICGEWRARNDSVNTIVEALDVRAWDAIDFVTDRIDANNWDRFHWPVRLTLTTRDGKDLKFDSAAVDLSPTRQNVLADVVLAAACLERDRLQPIGEAIIEKLLDISSRGASTLIRPVLQRAQAVAFASRHQDAGFSDFASAHPRNWVAVSGANAALSARGASRPAWLAYDEHLLQLSGAHSGALLFRYPLAGEFEFSCEAQQGGGYPTDGGLVYGGLKFFAHSGQQELTVHDADTTHFAKKPCPFIRSASDAAFNRLSIRSTATGATFTINGHPVWEDSRSADLSPWIGLGAFGDSRPLFRNIRITGSPVIPREVRLVDDQAMRGWQSSFFGQRQPSFLPGAGLDESLQESDWYVANGTIHGSQRDDGAESNPQSLLRYQRPLLDGESISYEFYYQPAEFEVHPALGRLAFLIESGGVRLHWLTDGTHEWTGLNADNAIVEPLSRRGPKPLPLRVNDWNRLSFSLAGEVVKLWLNDTFIYDHPLEPESERQFGLFHNRRRSAVRVRNVVMTGNWPETLPTEVFANLAAAASPSPSDAARAALNDVFGEHVLATNAFAVRERAASLSDEERFAFLSDWVLPSRGRRSFRLAGTFATTNPAPTDATYHFEVGGQLVAPAYDLVDVAARLDRLEELRERIATVEASDDVQQRARLALLFLVAAASENQRGAEAACEQLLALSEKRAVYQYATLWPETLVAVRGRRNSATLRSVTELCKYLLDPLLLGKSGGLDAWDHQIVALSGEQANQTTSEDAESHSTMANWIPASVETAQTRGQGQPMSRWQRRGDQVVKLAPHGTDLLYYRLPLTGSFDVEFTTSKYARHYAGLMFGGMFHAFFDDGAFHEGTLRSKQQVALEPPLSSEGKPVRMRLRVRDRTCTALINGREISSRQLPEHYQPWLAIYSDARHLSGVRDLRITGNPLVPKTVELAADGQLLGWLSYFDERVGTEVDGAAWRYREDPAGSWIVGVKEPASEGSFKESLLQYHRRITEDAVIEYEFFFEPGQTLVHPALDRLAFLLDPAGVKLHWVTDGAYAVAGSDPANQTVESEFRSESTRGPEELPLRPNDWNEMKVTLRGETVRLTLNGELIHERKLEATNQRTFGLFHFADKTEARARNLVLRGDWPESVPSVARQELADISVALLDEALAELPAKFSYSFEGGRFPSKYFKPLVATQRTEFAPRDSGLFTGVTSRGSGVDLPVIPRFTVSGDFDIELAFEQLELRTDHYATILLHTEHAGDRNPFYRVMRMQELKTFERVKSQVALLRPDGGHTYESPQFESCASASGHLRLARRGDTIYFLFADGDSKMFRIIDSQKGSVTDTPADGIRFMPAADGDSAVSVVWKNISIRAEKMKYLPPSDGPPVRKLLLMNVDGSELREVTGSPEGFTNRGSPEWSASGKQLAFDVTAGNFSGTRMNVINADGTGLRDCGPGAMPSFTSDDKRIIFSQPGRGVMMMNADGSGRNDIDVRGWGAQASPDGNWIAWGRNGNIVVMNTKSKAQRLLLVGRQATLFSSTYWNLGWSRDSRSIAFKARNRQTGGDEIVVADIDSPDGFKILLAASTGLHADFSFSPDDNRILFAMQNPMHKGPQLYTIARDEDAPPRLIPGQPLNWMIYNGAWSPDGKQIALTGEKIPQPEEWPGSDLSNSAQLRNN